MHMLTHDGPFTPAVDSTGAVSTRAPLRCELRAVGVANTEPRSVTPHSAPTMDMLMHDGPSTPALYFAVAVSARVPLRLDLRPVGEADAAPRSCAALFTDHGHADARRPFHASYRFRCRC